MSDVISNVYVSGEGWCGFTPEGKFAGTVGSGKAIEMIVIDGVDYYQVHVQDLGWLDPVKSGVITGVIGKRIEAIKIGCENLNYQVHVQNVGWMGFARDGEVAGTEGKAYQIEAIRMVKSPERFDVNDERVSFKYVEPVKPIVNPVDDWYFGEDEFKCECGCGGDVCQELKEKMNEVRKIMGVPLYITSGYRCRYWNSEVGGVWDSLHMEGTACDGYVSGMSNEMVDRLADVALSVGLGVIRYYGQQFVHFQLYPRDTVVY
jgi:hypothetical protein